MEYYEELGLTKNEAKVYEALIKFGKLSAGEASGRSSVSYSKIYNVLDGLINKGLVKIIPEKTKKFVPTGPDSLIELIDKKEEKLVEVREKVKELKKFYDMKEKNPVVMSMGKKDFYKIVKDLKKPGKYHYRVKWSSEYRPDWARDTKANIRKGKDFKDLVRYDRETEGSVKKWLKVNKNIKKFPNEGVAISIIDDSEVMIGLIKSNVTLLIRDRAFCKIMKQLFLDSYERSENVR